MIESIKDKKGGKIITKFAATAPKSYSYTLQKDVQEKINVPIKKKQVSLRSINQIIYIITNNKIALHKLNYKERDNNKSSWIK